MLLGTHMRDVGARSDHTDVTRDGVMQDCRRLNLEREPRRTGQPAARTAAKHKGAQGMHVMCKTRVGESKQLRDTRLRPRWKDVIRAGARRITSLRIKRLEARVARLTAGQAPPGRAVVVAPHPDDEVFGCGGLIAQKAKRGEEVHVVFLTRGENPREATSVVQEATAAARVKLAHDALAVLGLGPERAHWLGLSDGRVPLRGAPGFEAAAASLQQALESIAPDLVLAPHERDVHHDHVAANQLTRHALEDSRALRGAATLFYATWMLHSWKTRDVLRRVRGSLFRLDIAEERAVKVAAIDTYLWGAGARDELGRPFVGDLPPGFVSIFTRPDEIYFRCNP